MRVRIEIIDNSTGQPVEAELFDEVTVEHFLETQHEWRPIVRKAAGQLANQGAPALIPQHFHWDWTSKAPQLESLANTFYGINYGDKLQGLMKLETIGQFCRCRLPEQEGRSLVYVDYIEVAPWNLKTLMHALGEKPQFNAIGSRLIEAAVRKSLEEDCRGRIGLHSLPITERFYIKACRMTPVGRDPAKQNLLWLEYTPEQADMFLKGAGS